MKRPLLYVIIAFIVSRLLYLWAGVRFDQSSLDHFWQYIDISLLQHNLGQSIWYLHSQPPLYNLFLGCVLKLSPHHTALAFHLAYLTCGLTMAVSMFLLMVGLRVSSKLAAVLTILFVVSPSAVLYENWLFYTYPLAAMLALSALLLHRFLSCPKLSRGAAFFGVMACIVLTRSLFHIAWFALFVLILLAWKRRDWKVILCSACVPFLLIFIWYAKNLYLFGQFTSSTWMGMSLAKITAFQLPEKERLTLKNQGKVSELAFIVPFSRIEKYTGYLNRSKTGIPVLDQRSKPHGESNYNNVAYIQISRQYGRDAAYVLKSHPEAYVIGTVKSYGVFFLPASEYAFLKGNRERVQGLDRFYSLVFTGRLLEDARPALKDPNVGVVRKFLNMGLFLVAGYGIAAFYGLVLALRALRRKPMDAPLALTVVFLWINIVYVTLVGNSFEVGENNRFRVMIDPFMTVMVALFLNEGIRKMSLRGSRRPELEERPG